MGYPLLNEGFLLQEAFNSADTTALDEKRFGMLDVLLNQTDMYTQFLQQQMTDVAKDTDNQIEEALASAPAGTKRKTSSRARADKRQKVAETPTQVGSYSV
jgi:hypothetical protein